MLAPVSILDMERRIDWGGSAAPVPTGSRWMVSDAPRRVVWTSARGASGGLPMVMRQGVESAEPQQAEDAATSPLMASPGPEPESAQQQQGPKHSMKAGTTANTGLAIRVINKVRQTNRAMIIGRLWNRLGFIVGSIK
jgi:hypothetical protein